ncbi:transglycosylase SLT domain-containing protein [Caenispirillum bisanense]|uniref:Transglycosylase SLT domain-containing protein n=1 Tax=Caenispirillum bisanense TaxID=414052 RepID=A0A286GZ66_9PROT|nr:transglycosylase SLT domain-containing protein [Caenispirillum bisanense]SOE00364.1 Transglycosylase SLT domain-containing protein [Caenispirillum bisanense]
MRRRSLPRLIGLLAALAVALPAAAASAMPALDGGGEGDCRPLAAQAEAEFGVPPGILQAIALVESGLGGRAWPWTINASGRPFYLRTHSDAVVVAEAAMRHFGDAIAIGCMQVYLRWHAENFTDVQQMLQPAHNVRYAAAYLVSLRRERGSWEAAVRHYHGSERRAQADYLCKVLAARTRLGYQDVTDAMRDRCAAPETLVRLADRDGGGS